MPSLALHTDRLVITLSKTEKALSLRKKDIEIDRDSIKNATITDDPWIWLRGLRSPGTSIPHVIAVGQWRYTSGTDFVVVKAKRQAVVLQLIGSEFARVIVSTKHAGALVAALRLDADVPDHLKPTEPR